MRWIISQIWLVFLWILVKIKKCLINNHRHSQIWKKIRCHCLRHKHKFQTNSVKINSNMSNSPSRTKWISMDKTKLKTSRNFCKRTKISLDNHKWFKITNNCWIWWITFNLRKILFYNSSKINLKIN